MSRIADDHNTYADDWSLFDLNIPIIFLICLNFVDNVIYLPWD